MVIDIFKINVRNDDDDAPTLDMSLLLFLCARKEKAFLVVLLSRCSFFPSYKKKEFSFRLTFCMLRKLSV